MLWAPAATYAPLPRVPQSINPARSFGTAAVANFWTDQWIFWVGPLMGLVVALLTYELFFFGRRSFNPVPADEPPATPTPGAAAVTAPLLALDARAGGDALGSTA